MAIRHGGVQGGKRSKKRKVSDIPLRLYRQGNRLIVPPGGSRSGTAGEA